MSAHFSEEMKRKELEEKEQDSCSVEDNTEESDFEESELDDLDTSLEGERTTRKNKRKLGNVSDFFFL